MPEQEEPQKSVSDLSDAELMRELIAYFGTQRFVEVMGWCALAMIVSGYGDPVEFREKLKARGFHQSGMYRALADIKKFGEHYEGTQYPAQDHRPTMRIVERIGRLKTA